MLHVLRVHIPIDKIHPFPLSNILLVHGQFWGFDRLMMFSIGTDLQQIRSIQKNNIKKELKNIPSTEACEVASWAL